MGFDPGVFGRFDLAALVQPHLQFLFVCLLGMHMGFVGCVVELLCLLCGQSSSSAF